MKKEKFAFDKTNYIMLAIGMAIIILGFLLMSGSGTTSSEFNPDIFSVRRIKVAPIISLIGFVFMILAVLHKPNSGKE